jgi:hypothetical protein
MKKWLVLVLVLALACLSILPMAVFAAGPTNVSMTWYGTNVNVGNSVNLGDDIAASFSSKASFGYGDFCATYIPGKNDMAGSSINAVTFGKGSTMYSVDPIGGLFISGVSSQDGMTWTKATVTAANDSLSYANWDVGAKGCDDAYIIGAYVGDNSTGGKGTIGQGGFDLKGLLDGGN